MIRTSAIVLSQENIAADVYDMRIGCGPIAREAKPGQFLSLYCADQSRLLPRPISVCDADQERGIVRLVYRRAGAGTEEFSRYLPGDSIQVLGPLGNGYPLKQLRGKSVWLLGGGIGIPPMLYLAKALCAPEGSLAQKDEEDAAVVAPAQANPEGDSAREEKRELSVILGYRDSLFLERDFATLPGVKVHMAMEDGSAGAKGTVFDALPKQTPEVICACGPTPMLRAVRRYAMERGIACYLSLEQRMACGVGACLGCVCESVREDAHSKVRNKRICAEGPVFAAEEIVL